MNTNVGVVSCPQLQEGNQVTRYFTFNSVWCDLFFRLSGDKNKSLHGKGGDGIVQGAAILTRIGTMISEEMPGYGPVEFAVSFMHSVRVGETIALTLRRLDSKRARTRVALSISVEGRVVAECTVTLIPARFILRRLESQVQR